jgi:DNA-binding LytR/AlgR family response regulator
VRESKLHIAIIDDEQHAIETLEYDLCESFHQIIEIAFTTTNPFEGARLVRLLKPDILFLDIMMPGLSGLEIIHLIDDLETKVVFTTAFLDLLKQDETSKSLTCLLKPVSISELGKIFNLEYKKLKL